MKRKAMKNFIKRRLRLYSEHYCDIDSIFLPINITNHAVFLIEYFTFDGRD